MYKLFKKFKFCEKIGDGDWGLGPSPIPNPQSP